MQSQLHRLVIIAISAVVAIGLNVGIAEEKEAPKNPLLGSWQLVRFKYGDAPDYSDFAKGTRRLKLLTDTHWSWVQYDKAGVKEAKSGMGGPYTLKGDDYTETAEFATGEMVAFLDKTHPFKVRVEGDKWFLSGTLANGLKIEEIWQRTK